MKQVHKLTLLVIIISAVLLAACGGEGSGTSGDTVTDYDSFIQALRTNGAAVEAAGTVSQPFFSVEGKILSVEGQDVQVFEYLDADTAQAEAELVSPDGSSVGTSMVTWIEAPHFYRTGKLIALYVGSSESVLNVLEVVLGPQFAGRS
jgi:hypothetical protein